MPIIAKKLILGKNLCYNLVMKTVYNCIECDRPLSGKQRSFCSDICKNDHFLNYDTVKARAIERKTRLISALTGGCRRCGYDENIAALSFYDRAGDSLHIDINILANSNYEKLVNKLKDAQVLCRNCAIKSSNDEEIEHICYSDISEKTSEKFHYNFVQLGINNDPILVLGVSGGVDSVVMLDLVSRVHPPAKIVVAHVNHALRPDSDTDEIFVKNLAKHYGVNFVSKKLPPYQTGNQEEYFRDERRKFLLGIAAKHNSSLLALAHNADDQAETFLMNALRGSGPAGLGAMSKQEGQIVRPLLDISRAEIEAYAKEHQLGWREDATNMDISYNRNYIRHRILPLLAHLKPDYLNAIQRTTRLQRRIEEHLKEEAKQIITDNQLQITRLKNISKPVLYEAIVMLYEQKKGDRQNFALSHIMSIEELMQDESGTKTLDLPGGIVARRRYDKLDFLPKKEHNNPSETSTKKLSTRVHTFGDWEVSITEGGKPSSTSIIIDAERLPRLAIRHRKPGDRIRSSGMAGRKRLQDIFVDAKIDRARRDNWPIVTDTETDEILWIPGLAGTKVDTKTKTLLTINIVEAAHETTKEK